MSESMDTSTSTEAATKTEPRGKWKSGRWWKEPTKRENRLTGIIKTNNLKSSWDEKMKAKALKQQFKSQQQEIKDRIAAEKQAKAKARKEREERRKANELKSEVVQVIRNTAKLKRTKKKNLRNIQKRDTTKM